MHKYESECETRSLDAMNSQQGTKWMSYLDEDNVLLMTDPGGAAAPPWDITDNGKEPSSIDPLLWCSNEQQEYASQQQQQMQHQLEEAGCHEQAECSGNAAGSHVDLASRGLDNGGGRRQKRLREEPTISGAVSGGKKQQQQQDSACAGGASSKSTREKLRRDKLNDLFMELSQVLDPGRPPKSDKATILSDAAKAVVQLRAEAQLLKEGSDQLREQITELKGEKSELRDEKARLKAEKERLEQHQQQQQHLQMVALSNPAYAAHPHPASMQALSAGTPFAAQPHHSAAIKPTAPVPSYPVMPMWRWMPPSSLDTSQDHVRYPPVA
eukprot:TRINITY_DN123_c1_g1_i1.p1 TRINITY_DN123_c1_g1~~TRINITY_DN123_c1_g1_i1.p1  ORF type:complete len:326 (+),score=87.27 TRINITY_DN123_c1_g1_i1:109-1086(+)